MSYFINTHQNNYFYCQLVCICQLMWWCVNWCVFVNWQVNSNWKKIDKYTPKKIWQLEENSQLEENWQIHTKEDLTIFFQTWGLVWSVLVCIKCDSWLATSLLPSIYTPCCLLYKYHIITSSTSNSFTACLGSSKIMGKWSFVSAVPSFLFYICRFPLRWRTVINYGHSFSLFSSCWCSGKIKIGGIKMKIMGKKYYTSLSEFLISSTWWYQVWFILVYYASFVDN
jgi:hypothetical protein